MIKSLDQPLPLARIDTIFVMVDLTEQNQRGIDALFGGLEWSEFAVEQEETISLVTGDLNHTGD